MICIMRTLVALDSLLLLFDTFQILLCQMLPMEVIRPILLQDINTLQMSMKRGYISGLYSFCVIIEHVDGMTTKVDDNIMSTWNYEH